MIRTETLSVDPAAVSRAAEVLRRGGLVAFPTETVYGLGADASSGEAVARLYAAKERPRFNPLIAHVPDVIAARTVGVFDAAAERLAETLWPGPLTLVLPLRLGAPVCDLARAGLDSVALRVPLHRVARDLIREVGRPVAAPSANRSGRISPTDAEAVLAELDGRVDLILDGGATKIGLESTIVSCLGEPVLLRPGGISREAIEAALGRPLRDAEAGCAVTAPGMLASHYAPGARVRLGARTAEPHEAVLDFGGGLAGQGAGPYLDLSPGRDLGEAAANLFSCLRRLDGMAPAIAVASIPAEGIGEAINDRLARAAAPRA
jgi:L-threonylcarbamoyladenylate synthase